MYGNSSLLSDRYIPECPLIREVSQRKFLLMKTEFNTKSLLQKYLVAFSIVLLNNMHVNGDRPYILGSIVIINLCMVD